MTEQEPSPSTEPQREAPRGLYVATLVLLLLIAAVLRFSRFDLIEFKTDEAMICDITAVMLDSGRPATHGLVSGKGITNFPMFAYLLALPMVVTRHPSPLTGLITLSNLVAIWILFRGSVRRWGIGVAFWAALLMGTAPWAILYSRKIWAQDVLPVLLVPALFLLLDVIDGKQRRVFGLLLLTGVAAMTHLSGVCAVAAALVCLAVYRPKIDWPRAGAAVGVLFVLAAPYVYYFATKGAKERAIASKFMSGAGTAEEYKSSPAQIVGTGLDVVTDHGFDRILGQPARDPIPTYGWCRPGSVAGRSVATLAVLGLPLFAAGAIGRRRRPAGTGLTPCSTRDATVLLVWLAAPLLLYGLFGIRVYTHYFIVTMPALFLAMGLLLEMVRRLGGSSRRAWANNLLQAVPIALGLGIACSGALSWWTMLRCLAANGGAPGSYEVALVHKQEAIDAIVSAAGGRAISLVGDTQARTLQPGSEDYEYLLRLAQRGRRDPNPDIAGPPRNFVVLDLYRYNLSPAERSAAAAYHRKQFGPIQVLALPDGRSAETAGPQSPQETR